MLRHRVHQPEAVPAPSRAAADPAPRANVGRQFRRAGSPGAPAQPSATADPGVRRVAAAELVCVPRAAGADGIRGRDHAGEGHRRGRILQVSQFQAVQQLGLMKGRGSSARMPTDMWPRARISAAAAEDPNP
jgi:hypothetical protein